MWTRDGDLNESFIVPGQGHVVHRVAYLNQAHTFTRIKKIVVEWHDSTARDEVILKLYAADKVIFKYLIQRCSETFAGAHIGVYAASDRWIVELTYPAVTWQNLRYFINSEIIVDQHTLQELGAIFAAYDNCHHFVGFTHQVAESSRIADQDNLRCLSADAALSMDRLDVGCRHVYEIMLHLYEYRYDYDREFVSSRLRSGTSLNHAANVYDSLLVWAARHHDHYLFSMFLFYGADPLRRYDLNLNCAFDLVVSGDDPKMLAIILSKITRINLYPIAAPPQTVIERLLMRAIQTMTTRVYQQQYRPQCLGCRMTSNGSDNRVTSKFIFKQHQFSPLIITTSIIPAESLSSSEFRDLTQKFCQAFQIEGDTDSSQTCAGLNSKLTSGNVLVELIYVGKEECKRVVGFNLFSIVCPIDPKRDIELHLDGAFIDKPYRGLSLMSLLNMRLAYVINRLLPNRPVAVFGFVIDYSSLRMLEPYEYAPKYRDQLTESRLVDIVNRKLKAPNQCVISPQRGEFFAYDPYISLKGDRQTPAAAREAFLYFLGRQTQQYNQGRGLPILYYISLQTLATLSANVQKTLGLNLVRHVQLLCQISHQLLAPSLHLTGKQPEVNIERQTSGVRILSRL